MRRNSKHKGSRDRAQTRHKKLDIGRNLREYIAPQPPGPLIGDRDAGLKETGSIWIRDTLVEATPHHIFRVLRGIDPELSRVMHQPTPMFVPEPRLTIYDANSSKDSAAVQS